MHTDVHGQVCEEEQTDGKHTHTQSHFVISGLFLDPTFPFPQEDAFVLLTAHWVFICECVCLCYNHISVTFRGKYVLVCTCVNEGEMHKSICMLFPRGPLWLWVPLFNLGTV